MDDTKDVDVVMPVHNLLDYTHNYEKTSGSLWQYWQDDPNDNKTDCDSIKFEIRFKNNTKITDIANVEIATPVRYFSDFWRTLEMLLINCKINLMLTWSVNRVIYDADKATTLAIPNTKLDV